MWQCLEAFLAVRGRGESPWHPVGGGQDAAELPTVPRTAPQQRIIGLRWPIVEKPCCQRRGSMWQMHHRNSSRQWEKPSCWTFESQHPPLCVSFYEDGSSYAWRLLVLILRHVWCLLRTCLPLFILNGDFYCEVICKVLELNSKVYCVYHIRNCFCLLEHLNFIFLFKFWYFVLLLGGNGWCLFIFYFPLLCLDPAKEGVLINSWVWVAFMWCVRTESIALASADISALYCLRKKRAKAFFLPFSFGSLHLLSPMLTASSSPHPPQLAAHLVLS